MPELSQVSIIVGCGGGGGCHTLNGTGWVVKNGLLQFLWMNQLALPDVLQLLTCKCQMDF